MSRLYRLGNLSENTEAFSKITDRDLQIELLRILTCAEYVGLANILIDNEHRSKRESARDKNNNLFNLAARVEGLELTKEELFPDPEHPTVDKIIDTAIKLKERWDKETLK